MNTDWFRNATIYHLLIDRFSRGRLGDQSACEGAVFCGGTIRGLIQRLPYLEALGVNTIWMSPFNTTVGYHGYHITDFFGVDPHFGTSDDIDELIELCHRRGLRLLMDFVANHVHKSHPFFKEALANRASQYRRWFYFRGNNSYLSFLSFDELPKLNLMNNEAASYVIKAALFWLDQGFDGFRLDHVIGPPMQFWQRFAAEIKARHEGAVLIGEASLAGVGWHDLETIDVQHKGILWLLGKMGFDTSAPVMHQYVGVLDGALDFTFQNLMRRFVAEHHWCWPGWLLPSVLRHHYRQFPEGFYLPSFLDNHDMSRFLYQAGQDKSRLKEAAYIQFDQPQPPIIYYGTEVGMSQNMPSSPDRPFSDLEARQLMRWDSKDQDLDLLEFYRKLVAKRLKCASPKKI